MRPTNEDDPIEVHLPDGGHLILAIRDETTRLSRVGYQLIGALLRAEGSEGDVELAIKEQAEGMGLPYDSSSSRHPTVIVIGGSSAPDE